MNKYNTKITKIDNIQDVNYIEEFDFQFRNFNHKIKYLHYAPNRSLENMENDPYIKNFSEFVTKVAEFIPDGSEVIDIGAYDGDTSLPLALLAGKNGRCINFECGPAWHRLQINTALNTSLNTENYNYAVSNHNGIDQFNYQDDVGGSRYKTDHIGTYPLKRFVRTIQLEKFLDTLNLKNVNFVKLDTEGFDVPILFFMQKYIDQFRPILHIEWFPTTEQDLLQFLQSKNYFSVDYYTLKTFDKLPNYWVQDLLLIPKEKENNFPSLVK
jgi:FkbM family methyltransferase